MRAFILRRLALISHGYGNVILMGSRHCANTLRIREFLGRNAHPYTYIDLDTDKTSQELLDRFEVKTEEVPVVVCNGQTVLRNPSIQQLADCLGLNTQYRSIPGTRCDHRRRWTRRPGGCCLRGIEGLDALMIEADVSRRASRFQFEDRKLSGLSHRSLRTGAGYEGDHAGAEVRGADDGGAQGCPVALRRRPYEVVLDNGNTSVGARYRDLHRSTVQQAASP